MIRFNAQIIDGYMSRDKRFMHWVQPDGRGAAPVGPVEFERALPEGKRVRLDGRRIVEVQ